MSIPPVDIDEMWIGGVPPALAYLHIFKSGGSSVIEILNRLLRKHLILTRFYFSELGFVDIAALCELNEVFLGE